MTKVLQKQIKRVQSRLTHFDRGERLWGDGRRRASGGYHRPGSMNRKKGSALRAKRG